MELSLSSAGGRREERLPLDVLVELRSDDGDDVLEADGLDVSPHGMAVRASFVPPVGAHLRCQFRCPPDGEPVRAEGEVVWGEWTGPRVGTFGMRFLALDTRSATVIRQYVEPEESEPEPKEPEPTRVATLRIEGLSAPVEAEVRLADSGRVVLEQELEFLKLGRVVELDVPGRGKQRGRIGSIDLRHTHLDVPTLVFGILLDEVKGAEAVHAARDERASLPATARVEPEAPSDMVELDATLAEVRAKASEVVEAQVANAVEAQEPTIQVEPSADVAQPAAQTSAEELDEYLVKRDEPPTVEPPVTARRAVARKRDRALSAREQAPAEDDELSLLARKKEIPPSRVSPRQALVAWLVRVRAMLLPLWARVQARLAAWRSESAPGLRQTWVRFFARLRDLANAQWQRLLALRGSRKEPRKQQRTQAPRVQRAAVAREAQRERTAREQRPSREQLRTRRAYAAALALAGVALGVYALSPRSGAERMRVPHESLRPAPALAAEAVPEAATTAAPVLPEANVPTPAAEAVATNVAPEATQAAPGEAKSLVFGEPEVPHGRTFVLRMSGPVEALEGERRDTGFTVRIPGRLALDRASPIATSHRAVARAMVLNRGDYAELTVDFLPGMRPKYQVVGKDSSIEITLERQ